METPKANIVKDIHLRNMRRESRLSSLATKSRNATRRIKEEKNIRLNYAHDADRIIHSMAYSRYLGKTQVFFQVGNDHITRRALHVQLVAKIARTLARFLNANEDLAEAIALAHDIGHTPFGHAGEDALANCMEKRDAGSFFHSAQSVRILESIEGNGKGLNLSLAVLDGILGHNGEIIKNEISYDPKNLTFERLDFETSNCLSRPRKERYEKNVFPSTLEGCIVRVSDMIAYIGRDFEDAINMKLITRDDIPQNVANVLGNTNRDIVNNLCVDVMNNSYDGEKIRFSDKVFSAVNDLKKFNIERIYLNHIIMKQATRFTPMLEAMFNQFVEDINSRNDESIIQKCFLKDMPDDYLSLTSTDRKVADFISAMTDDFFMTVYTRLFLPERIDYGEEIDKFAFNNFS